MAPPIVPRFGYGCTRGVAYVQPITWYATLCPRTFHVVPPQLADSCFSIKPPVPCALLAPAVNRGLRAQAATTAAASTRHVRRYAEHRREPRACGALHGSLGSRGEGGTGLRDYDA